MRLHLAWMHAATLLNEAQELGGPFACVCIPGARKARARVHQLVALPRQKAIVDEETLLDLQLGIRTLQVTRAVILHAVSQDEVLRPGGGGEGQKGEQAEKEGAHASDIVSPGLEAKSARRIPGNEKGPAFAGPFPWPP